MSARWLRLLAVIQQTREHLAARRRILGNATEPAKSAAAGVSLADCHT